MYKRSKAEVERIVNSLKGPVPPPPESMLDRMRNEYNAQMSPQYGREVKLEREQERQRMEQEERDFNANWDRQRREHLVGLPPSPRPPHRERDQTGRRWSAVSPQKQTRHYRFAEPIPFPSLEGGRSRGDTQRKHMKHVARCLELRGGSAAEDFSGFIRGLQDPNSLASTLVKTGMPPLVGQLLTGVQIAAPLIRQAFQTVPVETSEDAYRRQVEEYNASERGKYYNELEAAKKAIDAENALVLERMKERLRRDIPPGYVAVPPPVVDQRPSPGIKITPRSTDKYVSCNTQQGHTKRRGTCVDRSGNEVEGYSYAGGNLRAECWKFGRDFVPMRYQPSKCYNIHTDQTAIIGGNYS